MRPLLLLLLCATWLAGGASAEPITVFVDAANGSDTGDGSAESPLATLGAAFALAQAGDTVAVAPGTYAEDVALEDGVALTGAGAAVTTLAGSLGCAATRIAGFTLEQALACGVAARIERCRVRSGLTVSGAAVEIVGNEFSAQLGGAPAGPEGVVRVLGGASALVASNSFYGTYGVQLEAGAAATIVNNLLVYGRRGIELAEGASAEIRHNDVYENQQGFFGFRSDYVGLEDQTGVAGNVAVEPSFVDAEEGDLRLRGDSPALDAGSNDDVSLAEDLDGTARLLDGDGDENAVVDLGAHELDPAEELPHVVAVDPEPRSSRDRVRARDLGTDRPEKRKLEVAILANDELAVAEEVDPATLRLGSFPALRCRAKDSDRDRRDDLVCKFPVDGLSIGTFPITNATACVRGATFEDRGLIGCAPVEIVP